MAIKTNIINDIVTYISTNTIFKHVKRGFVALNDRSLTYPSCYVSSYKVSLNTGLTSFNKRVYTMKVLLDILGKDRTNYFISMDSLEETVYKLMDELEEPSILINNNIIKIEFVDSNEVINDNNIDGIFEIQVYFDVDYFI